MTPDQWDFDNSTNASNSSDALFGQTPSGPPTQPRPGATTTPLPAAGPPVTTQLPTYPPPTGQSPVSAQRFGYAEPVTAPPAAGQALGSAAAAPAAQARWGWRALLAFVAGGSMVAGGFGVAQINNDPSTVAAVSTTNPPIVPATASEIDAAAEPVAYVAAVLSPSVVRIETNLGLGSGIIVDSTTVITNNHVIDGASEITINLSDGTRLPGTLVGSDARTDVAVISVPEGSNLPPAQLARDVELTVGQLTVAIGSPFDLQQTVTSGIISALDRPIQTTESTINAMIQTDTAINPGNSGGALADREGRVIGMNTLIQTDGSSNTNIGLGFATPIDTVMKVAERIMSGESLTPGFMGLQGSPDDNGLAGVVVRDVTAGSGADEAGVQVGDRVLRIDGAPVSSLEELAGLVQSDFPGDTVEIVVIRDGAELTIPIVLGEK